MRTRQIAGTDLALSEIGFGCGDNAGLMVRGSAREQEWAVGRALDLGINYFDNASDYGDGAAEESLGRALKTLRQRPLVASKVEVRADDLADIAGHVLRSIETSLMRLRVDHLDVVQIHNGPAAERPKLQRRSYSRLWIEDYLRSGGAIDGIERAIRHGKVRYAGFICCGNDGVEVGRLLDTKLFHLISVPYTLLNPSAGQEPPAGLTVDRDYANVISAARERGVGAAIDSPLAGGVLTDDAVRGRPRHPLAPPARNDDEQTARERTRAAALRFLCKETGLSLAQAAFRFILMHEGVTTALGGFSSIAQMEEIVKAAAAPPFEPELMARLDELWRRDFA